MQATEKDFLSTKECADLLGVHEATVRKWCRTGMLRALRVGTKYHVPRAALYGEGR